MSNKATKLDFRGQVFHIGIDVHKRNWRVTVLNNGLELKTFSINPSPEGLSSYLQSKYPGGEYYTAYEAGFCGYWIHRKLESLGIKNLVVNPADIPVNFKETVRKTDTIDSRRLARALYSNLAHGNYIPSLEQQGFRSLCRLRKQLVKDQARVKNRIKSFLDFSGIKVLSQNEISHWSGLFLNYLSNLDLGNEHSNETLSRMLGQLMSLRNQIADLVKRLKTIVRQDEAILRVMNNLMTIPGVGFSCAIVLYSELMDINRFSSVDKLCSYVGLVPDLRSSGESEYTLGISKLQLQFLRAMLIECSWIAIRKDPALTAAFNTLSMRMKKQEAIIRIGKKLLTRIMYVWRNNEPYICSIV